MKLMEEAARQVAEAQAIRYAEQVAWLDFRWWEMFFKHEGPLAPGQASATHWSNLGNHVDSAFFKFIGQFHPLDTYSLEQLFFDRYGRTRAALESAS